jgi:hypothetical protein
VVVSVEGFGFLILRVVPKQLVLELGPNFWRLRSTTE